MSEPSLVRTLEATRARNGGRIFAVALLGVVTLVLLFGMFLFFKSQLLPKGDWGAALWSAIADQNFRSQNQSFVILAALHGVLTSLMLAMTVSACTPLVGNARELRRLRQGNLAGLLAGIAEDAATHANDAKARHLKDALSNALASGGAHNDAVRRRLEWARDLVGDAIQGAELAPFRLETPARALQGHTLMQTLAHSILLSGIIGTFFGMFVAFSGSQFASLLSALANRSNIGVGMLSGVIDGFAIAFASSLLAYVAHLFARAQLSLVDSGAVDVADLFEHDVARAVILAVGRLGGARGSSFAARPQPGTLSTAAPRPSPPTIAAVPSASSGDLSKLVAAGAKLADEVNKLRDVVDKANLGQLSEDLGAVKTVAQRYGGDFEGLRAWGSTIAAEVGPLRAVLEQTRERYQQLTELLTAGGKSWEDTGNKLAGEVSQLRVVVHEAKLGQLVGELRELKTAAQRYNVDLTELHAWGSVIAAEMGPLRAILEQARERYRQLTELLTTGRESWEAAAETWREATAGFKATAVSMNNIVDTFNDSWREAAAMYLQESARSAEAFIATMDSLRAAVNQHVKDLDNIRDAHKEATEENTRGREILSVALAESQDRIIAAQAAFTQALTKLDGHASESVKHLDGRISSMLGEIQAAVETLRRIQSDSTSGFSGLSDDIRALHGTTFGQESGP